MYTFLYTSFCCFHLFYTLYLEPNPNAKNAVWLLCDTTSYVNEDLYMDTEILTGCDIYMKDDFIYDAILRVRPKNSVTIDGEFYIENGILDIKRITDY